MSCNEYEMLMADVLGGEASDDNRNRFEAHCASCHSCRVDYETALRTLDVMRSLRAPDVVVPLDVSLHSQMHRSGRGSLIRNIGPILRIAAAIILSFSAGYLYHAVRARPAVVQDSPSPGKEPEQHAPRSTPPLNFESALAIAHARNPSRSDLGKAMSAVLRP